MHKQYIHAPLSNAHIAKQLADIEAADFADNEINLSDLELLSSATVAALTAANQGLILGTLDEMALQRAERVARLHDSRRNRTAVVLGGAA